ncbi:MAG: hypothetical protein H0U69_00915 [Trueperaceae bacterium]|nr:hypothetical protein [Trueperaceae bacterium]
MAGSAQERLRAIFAGTVIAVEPHPDANAGADVDETIDSDAPPEVADSPVLDD